MNEYVIEMMTALSDVVYTLPVGTNLGILHLLWAMVAGQLLVSRGAVIPALKQIGLSDRAVRRSWQALRRGGWVIGVMLINWEAVVLGGKHWVVREHGGYRVLAIDITAFWRPALKDCRTKHYNQQAGKALPAMVFGFAPRYYYTTQPPHRA